MSKEKKSALTDDEKIIMGISELREALGMWPSATLEQMVRHAREIHADLRDLENTVAAIQSGANARVAAAEQLAREQVAQARDELNRHLRSHELLVTQRKKKEVQQLLGH